MKILVDTNRIIAALVQESTTRDILFDENFEFVTPDYTRIEIEEHKEELRKKTKLTDKEFEILLTLIQSLLKEVVEMGDKISYKEQVMRNKSIFDDYTNGQN